MQNYFSCRATRLWRQRETIAVRLRWLRRQISPWLVVAISSLNMVLSDGIELYRQRVRVMVALSQINFAGVYELLNDLIW